MGAVVHLHPAVPAVEAPNGDVNLYRDGRKWRWFFDGPHLRVVDHNVEHVGGHIYRLARRCVARPETIFVVLWRGHLMVCS